MTAISSQAVRLHEVSYFWWPSISLLPRMQQSRVRSLAGYAFLVSPWGCNYFCRKFLFTNAPAENPKSLHSAFIMKAYVPLIMIRPLFAPLEIFNKTRLKPARLSSALFLTSHSSFIQYNTYTQSSLTSFLQRSAIWPTEVGHTFSAIHCKAAQTPKIRKSRRWCSSNGN